MKKTRVLMFGWEFPPFNSGGLGVACYGLTRSLARNGAEVLFVLPKKVAVSPDFMKVLFADATSSVTMYSIDTLLSPYETVTTYGKKRSVSHSPIYAKNLCDEVLRYAQRASCIAQEQKFDVIYAHDWLSFPAGIEARKVSGKPLIAHIHATEYDRCGGDNVNEKIAHIEQEGLHAADRIVAVSHYTKQIVIDRYGISEEKIDVVYNGIDREDFPMSTARSETLRTLKESGVKIVLFVGRLTLQKGLEYFLSAAKKALEYKSNIRFVIAGTGDMQEQIMHQVAELGISDKVLFMGFVRGEELQEAYRMADLYVMPSVSEPFGITTLEAMLHGAPVIVSRQSGVSEVALHVLKVDFWDTDEMAHKILSVVAHPALQKTLRENALQEVSSLTWNAVAQRCLYVFDKI